MTEERRLLRRALVIGLIMTLLIGAYFLHLDWAADPNASRKQTDRFPLPVPWTVFASICLGMGMGTQVSLVWSNWHRIGWILRPTPRRLIFTALLVLLVPVSQFWAIPITGGFIWYGVAAQLVSDDNLARYVEDNTVLILWVFVMVPVLVYPVTCLTLGGIRRNRLRVAVFGQTWLAFYGAALLATGFYSGNM